MSETAASPPPDAITISSVTKYAPTVFAVISGVAMAASVWVTTNNRIDALEARIVTLDRVNQRLARVEKNLAVLVCRADATKCAEAMAGVGD